METKSQTPRRTAAAMSGTSGSSASRSRPVASASPSNAATKASGSERRVEKTKYKAATPKAARGTPTNARAAKVAQSEPPLRKKRLEKARMDSFELSPSQSKSSTPMYSSGAKSRLKAPDSSALSQQAQELLSTILEDSHDGGYSSSSSVEHFEEQMTPKTPKSSQVVRSSPAVAKSSREAVSAKKRATAAAVAASARSATSERKASGVHRTAEKPLEKQPEKKIAGRRPAEKKAAAPSPSTRLKRPGTAASSRTTVQRSSPAAAATAAPAAATTETVSARGRGSDQTSGKSAKKAIATGLASSVPEDGSESVYSDGFSYVHEILRLEGELKSKEHQLAGLVQETCRMERLLSKKEEALFELSVELHQAQETILQLDTTGEAAAKHKAVSAASLKALLAKREDDESDEEQQGEDEEGVAVGADGKTRNRSKKKGSSLDRLEREFRSISSKRSPTISYNATLPEDLYHHVMDLDNELAERERECAKLRDENRQYSMRNKELHLYYKRAVTELRDYKETREEQFLTEKHELEEKVRAHVRRERELVEELRSTRASDRTKAQVIKGLEDKIDHEESLEQRLKHLRTELKQLEQRNAALKADNSRQKKVIARKDKSLAKADAVQEAGIPFHLWKEERSQIMIKLKQLKELKDRNEKTIEKQKLRIHELCDRIDLIASSLYEDSRHVSDTRRMELINGSKRFPSCANSSARRGGGGAPAGPIVIDDSDTDVEEAELTEDLLETDEYQDSNRAGSTVDGDDTISVKLYELLEQEVRSLHQVIGERDALLSDKDAKIESLERELDSLSRMKVVRSQKEAEKLKEKLESVETENKNREKQYRLQLHKMKAKLEDQE